MILISANGLGRQFAGDPVFSELKFEVRAGERVGLVGPNGGGKTQLMRLLAGERAPDAGEVLLGPRVSAGLFTQLNTRADFKHRGVLDIAEDRVVWSTEAPWRAATGSSG